MIFELNDNFIQVFDHEDCKSIRNFSVVETRHNVV